MNINTLMIIIIVKTQAIIIILVNTEVLHIPEITNIEKVKKLVSNLHNQKEYAVHIKN